MEVRVSPVALRTIKREARASKDGNETGGILLGFGGNTDAVVTQAGGPGPNARRERTFFRRDLEHAERLAEIAFGIDGSQWIGDWHTHPGGGTEPSSTDLEAYRRILKEDPSLAAFITIIVDPGTADDSARLSPWLVTMESRAKVELVT